MVIPATMNTRIPDRQQEELSPAKKRRQVSAIPVALLSLFIVLVAWVWIYVVAEDPAKALSLISPKAKLIAVWSTAISPFLILGSVAAVTIWSYILVNKKMLFMVLLTISYVFSEVLLRGVNEIAFFVRYVSIIVLISLGAVELGKRFREGLDSTQVLGSAYLLWMIFNVLFVGSDISSFMMLPIQMAVLIGMFFGFKSIYGDYRDIENICTMLGWAGVCLTVFHLFSFALVGQPFLAGRFRSVFVFPTNFANTYALLFIPMVWFAMRERSFARKVGLWSLVLIGFSLLFLSGTRNSLAALILASPLFAVERRMRVAALTLLGVGVLVVFTFLSFHESETVGYLGERLTTFGSKDRYELWKLSWQYISSKPFVGYGLAKELLVPTYSALYGMMLTTINTHNAYLGIWMQTGLPSVLLVLAIYCISIGHGLTMLFSRRISQDMKGILVLPVILLVVLFAEGFLEENLTSRGSMQQVFWGMSVFLIARFKEIVSTGQVKVR